MRLGIPYQMWLLSTPFSLRYNPPRKYRSSRVLELLNTPIAGLGGQMPLVDSAWPDPGDVLVNGPRDLYRASDNESQWKSAVDLVVRGLVDNSKIRRKASIRMLPFIRSNLLTKDELKNITHALWDERYTLPDGLPANVALYDWAFLTMPKPIAKLMEKRFRDRWLLQNETQNVEEHLWQVGQAIRSRSENGLQFSISNAERAVLGKLVEAWTNAEIPERAPIAIPFGESYHREQVMKVAEILPDILSEIGDAGSLGGKLYQKMQVLNRNQIPAFTLAASVVKILPSQVAAVATILRAGLTSSDKDMAINAVSGVRLWIQSVLNDEADIPHPPEDLVREIGIVIASRRNPVLADALLVARWIFEIGNQTHKDAIRDLAQDGLTYLAEELSYTRRHENPDEIPLLRLRCAELAIAMARDGLGEDPIVARWLDMAKEDPLPEVRNAVSSDEMG